MFNLHDHISRKSLRTPRPGVSFTDQSTQLMAQSHEYLAYHTAQNVLAELRSGVTTIRDFGLAGTTGLAAKRAINEGVMPGPRLLPAGSPICITGGHAHHWGAREADGPDEVRRAVREQLKLGADCIKLMASGGLGAYPDEDPGIPELTPDELRAGIEEAKKFHKRTAAHAYSNVAIKNAVAAGIDSIEHGAFMDEEAIAMMRERGAAHVPTITGLVHIPYQYKSIGRDDMYELIMDRFIRPLQTSIRMSYEAGLRVGTGSDTAGEIVEELELIQESTGMSNLDAIRAATRVSAEIAAIESIAGTIEPGKRADLVVVDGRPLERLGDLRRPRWVFRDGQRFDGAPMPLGVRMRALQRSND
jgi:imidazolonepropionase-like amidohydrolase